MPISTQLDDINLNCQKTCHKNKFAFAENHISIPHHLEIIRRLQTLPMKTYVPVRILLGLLRTKVFPIQMGLLTIFAVA